MSTTPEGHIQVLTVDDEPQFRDLTETYLEREDDQFAVESATNADEAIEIISADPPDCVVSDYNMPSMDGLSLLERVRKQYPDLPFILYTGRGSEAVAGKAISAGVTDYLQKQSGTDQYELLANRIRNAVEARRTAERAARQEELMRLTEFAGDTGGFELDTETGEIVYTAGANRILNLPDGEEFTLDDWLEMFRSPDRKDIEAAIDRTLQTSEETRGTWHYQRPDGEERLLNLIFTPADPEESGREIRGAIHDDTERQQQERRYQALVEESDDIISIVGTGGVYRYLSPTVERILGYDPEELVGDSAWEYIHPDDRERVRESFQTWVSNPENQRTIEYRVEHADGSWRWIAARGNNQIDNPAVDGYIINSRDVTDRKRREQELTQTRDLMSSMEELADVGAWEYDPDAEQIVVTDGAAQLQELSPGVELTLPEAFEYIRPEDRERLENYLNTCLEDDDQYGIDVRLVTEDGKLRWITARGERVQKDGSGPKVRGYVRDITEQKDREQELERYRTVFDELPDPVVVYDEDGKYDLINDAATEILATSREELAGKSSPYFEQIRADHSEAYTALVEESKDTLEVELTDEFPGLGRRTLECRLSYVTEWSPSDGVVNVIHDVTDRKRREQELQNLKSQYQTLAENFPDGAVFLYNHDNEYVRVGGAELQTLGFSRDDFEGKTPHDLFPADIADETVEIYQKALQGESSSLEETYRGERYRVRVAPVRTDGEAVPYGIAVSQNITEQAERRQEIKRKNERLDEFASIVSHDLKSPLRVARGHLELAEEQVESDYVSKANGAIERGQDLIDDLLLLAREGNQVESIDPVLLSTVAESSWENIDTGTGTLDVGVSSIIQADRSRLKQLFENLFKNAVEQAEDTVTVSVGALPGGFYVADTGPGVPETERDEIFDAGYSTKDSGTGFGLRIVEQVTDAHGWDVTLTESEDGGARFEITGVEFGDEQ